MKAKFFINGFGRIGRLIFRVLIDRKDTEIIGINDPKMPTSLMHYLIKYDSAQGIFNNHTIEYDDNNLLIDNKKIPVFNTTCIGDLPLKQLNTDVVMECSGAIKTREDLEMFIQMGAKKVVLSSPSDIVKMYVMGVNDDTYDGDTIVSNASCTTNCLAPIAKILNDSFGIESGLMTTVHAITATQSTVDIASKKDIRSGRSGLNNIIPASTGAAKAVGKIIPQLNGKLTGDSLRVPIITGSIVCLTANLIKPTSVEDIKKAMKFASENQLKGILEYCEDPIVSSDIIGNPHTSIFDAQSIIAINEHFVKINSWYDNEWGYSNKMVLLALKILQN